MFAKMKTALFGASADNTGKEPDSRAEEGDENQEPTFNEEDILNTFMPEEMQEEMYCFTMGDSELHKLVPKHGKQMQECQFMRASIHLTCMSIPGDAGDTYSIPVVVASNDDYDEDQEQQAEEKIPITENLIFMRYATDEDGNEVQANRDDPDGEISAKTARIGYVFYYPELENNCKIIEADPTKENMREELQQFEQWVCKILYVINERKALKKSRSRTYNAQQEKRCANYCIKTDINVLLQQNVIGDIFNDFAGIDAQEEENNLAGAQQAEEESKEP